VENFEKIIMASVPVILGVIIAGYLMATLGPSVSVIQTASSGFTGSGS
jgi:hypothetical protein